MVGVRVGNGDGNDVLPGSWYWRKPSDDDSEAILS